MIKKEDFVGTPHLPPDYYMVIVETGQVLHNETAIFGGIIPHEDNVMTEIKMKIIKEQDFNLYDFIKIYKGFVYVREL